MEKKYSSSSEIDIRKKWETEKTYNKERQSGSLYSIDTPPPTVSGSLHVGHIFSYTHTDITARYKRMSGYAVFYPFGFDDNGLPTEKYVEKKCKVRAHELGRSKFIELCLEQTKEAEQQFKELWQRMGLSVDWNYWYSTISKEVRKISQLSFIKLYKENYIYRKDEPALYCTACRTTVAQAELDDATVPTFFNDIIFKDEEGNDLIISTTRPELLYSTSALLYHPDDKRYRHLKNKKAIVPVYNTQIPIYEDETVEIEKGTGLVMVSTFGDQNDIQWFKKFKLPLRLSIGFDGKLVPETNALAGLKAKDARKKILEILKEKNLLKDQKEITHTVNVHERCKNPIEYLVLPQWFIKILEYKDQFLKMGDQIEWYPSFMKSRYVNWVENVKWDWCISRQRFYGIPFPVWHCKCGEILLPEEKDLPIDPQETKYPGKCSKCGSSDITPDTDVMDTWNSSSLTPYINFNLFSPQKDIFTKDALNFVPMSMRPQAHDIIRTWAFYTIVKTWMHNKTIPWKQIVISGHVLSNKEKISKSKGNNPLAPENLLKTYSADVIRYWTATGSLGHDITFSETQLKIGQKLVTKLWNAFRFAHPHLEGFKPKDQPNELGIVNEWVLSQITTTCNSYNDYFEKQEFGLALDRIDQFFWKDFCDNYLELIKNQLFNPDEYSADQIYATKWTLYQVGLRILQLYAPYLPFITETIYALLYEKGVGIDSIHLTQFTAVQKPYEFLQAQTVMQHILHIVAETRKLKTEQQLSLKAEIQHLGLFSTNIKLLNQIKDEEPLLKGVTNAKKIEYHHKTIDSSMLKKVDDHFEAIISID